MRVRSPNVLYMCKVHVPLFLAMVEEQLEIQKFKTQNTNHQSNVTANHGLWSKSMNDIEVYNVNEPPILI